MDWLLSLWYDFSSFVYEPFRLKQVASKMEDIKPNILYEWRLIFILTDKSLLYDKGQKWVERRRLSICVGFWDFYLDIFLANIALRRKLFLRN